MCENILGRPAGEVEAGPVGQEAEAGGRERLAPLPRQQHVELLPQRMEVRHIGGGVSCGAYAQPSERTEDEAFG